MTTFLSPAGRALRAAALLTIVSIPALAGAQDTTRTAAGPEVMLAGSPRGADSTAGVAPTDSAAALASLRFARPAIFTKRDLMLGGGFAATALALFPMDQKITNWVRDPARQESESWQRTMEGAEWGVERGSYMASTALWLGGMVTRRRNVAEMGAHTLMSIGVTQGVTHVLKGAFGRSRPFQVADSLPHDWDIGGGFGASERRSFPSGHTSHAFAFATAMSHEISHNWPRAGKIATPLLFAGATTAALARVYNDKHWASDVTVGAAVGILSTRATLAYLHGRPRNVLDRLALNARIVPHRDGATVAVSMPAPR